jgi:isoleucyl-tRNA synthetase
VLNDLRKAGGFEISDRITVAYGSDRAELMAAIAGHHDWIAGEALATSLEPFSATPPAGATTATVGGEPILVELSRA